MKGFGSVAESEPYLDMASDLSPEALYFPDEGLDLGTYFAAAARLRCHRYCFLNSYSELLADGWLAKLERALAEPDVGMAGATGSWASNRSWVAYVLRMPSAYRELFPGRDVARKVFLEIDLERAGVSSRSFWETLSVKLQVMPHLAGQLIAYEPFPAYHLRTNAFVISHEMLTRLQLHAIGGKMDAYRLENSRSSITRQIQRLGLRTVLVDREGELYDHHRWDASQTLWQGAQEGLLVADNQTRSYASGNDDRRLVLSTFAWGPRARPGLRGDGTLTR